MTGQITDTMSYKGKRYYLNWADLGKLFDHKKYGIIPTPSCTACWHGFCGNYKIENDQLLLDSFEVSLSPSQNNIVPAPAIEGRKAVRGNSFMEYVYKDMNLEIPYSGILMIMTDFVKGLYEHLGFQATWKYGTVLELSLEDGKLIREEDLSDEVARFRARVKTGEENPLGCFTRDCSHYWLFRGDSEESS